MPTSQKSNRTWAQVEADARSQRASVAAALHGPDAARASKLVNALRKACGALPANLDAAGSVAEVVAGQVNAQKVKHG